MSFLKSHWPYLLIISCLSLFYKAYHLSRNMLFAWDQARDATVIYHLLHSFDVTLIGPRVISADGFFLGPYWYYLLAPWYAITNFDPIGAAVFGVVTGIITAILAYITIFQITTRRAAAFAAAFLFVIQPDRTIWNPMLIAPMTFILILLILRYLKTSNPINFIWLLLLVGLGWHVHVQAIFWTIPIVILLIYHWQDHHRLPIKQLGIGAAAAASTFLPLLLFDLRNQWINTHSILRFATNQSSNTSLLTTMPRSYEKFTNLLGGLFSVFEPNPQIVGGIILVISLIGIYWLPRRLGIISLSMIIGPLVILGLYAGNLPEYYYIVALIPIVIGIAQVINRGLNHYPKVIFPLYAIIAGLAFVQIMYVAKLDNPSGLYYQKQTVDFITSQTTDPAYTVSYEVPYTQDMGFKYLFLKAGNPLSDAPDAHLWTIVIPPNAKYDSKTEARFGAIQVVRR